MTFNEREQRLLAFAEKWHGDQKRKYIGDPYKVHLMAVAERVAQFGSVAVAAALCHDLIEDTNCTLEMLIAELERLEYSPTEVALIVFSVNELTDWRLAQCVLLT